MADRWFTVRCHEEVSFAATVSGLILGEERGEHQQFLIGTMDAKVSCYELR
jgi:hypothetical protein